ncbi:Flp family type IVb pilin [Virgibacillus byunsanensis]|uniref:Flp family type IVb pilin n=1 Tax=Virgibacillus byunsanensis TaxID=570945 RepID=A0ABW3LHN8_9BACI
MINKLKGLFLEEEGQGMTEYAIVLGVIAVGAIGVLVAFGDQLSVIIGDVTSKITGGFGS